MNIQGSILTKLVTAKVRKLAERSKPAADEIVALATESLLLLEKAGVLIGKVVPGLVKANQLAGQISSGSLEQNSSAREIGLSIQQLNDISQQNAAAIGEIATNAGELSSQADHLREIIRFYKT